MKLPKRGPYKVTFVYVTLPHVTSKFVNLAKLQELGRIEQVSESIIMAYNDSVGVEKVSFMGFFRFDLLGCVSISKDIFAKDIFAKDVFWTSAIWMGRE